MLRDKNADKRFEYNIKVSDKEREGDELRDQERFSNRMIESFETNMLQRFHNLQQIDEQIARRSEIQEIREIPLRRAHVQKLVDRQQEEMNQQYRNVKYKLEEERENLQRERDDLAWD